jgi:hypothetical protein
MDRDVRSLECDGRELKPTFKVAFPIDLAADCRGCANNKSHSSSGFGKRRAQFPQIGRTSSHYQLISKNTEDLGRPYFDLSSFADFAT